MTDRRRPEDPGALSPAELAERFLADRAIENADETLRSYRSRLEQFVAWCHERGVDRVEDLDGWLLDEYRAARQAEVAPVTVKGSMMAVKQLLDYGDRIGAVEEDLGDDVPIPRLDKAEETSDVRLATEDALALLRHYRETPAEFGTVQHALLELLWNVGCRRGGAHALDLDDYHPDERYVEFRHRPDQGTPLKNKLDGERPVALPEPVVQAIDFYVDRDRPDKRDEHGRRPLFATRQGRSSVATLQAWTYLSTDPCVHGPCPHGKNRRTCRYRERNHASKCPSSRSPHQVRTGSITWQLDSGLPIEVVAERANATPATIRRFYDKATGLEKLEQRRRQYTADFDIDP